MRPTFLFCNLHVTQAREGPKTPIVRRIFLGRFTSFQPRSKPEILRGPACHKPSELSAFVDHKPLVVLSVPPACVTLSYHDETSLDISHTALSVDKGR